MLLHDEELDYFRAIILFIISRRIYLFYSLLSSTFAGTLLEKMFSSSIKIKYTKAYKFYICNSK